MKSYRMRDGCSLVSTLAVTAVLFSNFFWPQTTVDAFGVSPTSSKPIIRTKTSCLNVAQRLFETLPSATTKVDICCPNARNSPTREHFFKDIAFRAKWRVQRQLQEQDRKIGAEAAAKEEAWMQHVIDEIQHPLEEEEIEEAIEKPKLVATLAQIASAFPKAITNNELVSKVSKELSVHGFRSGLGSSNTLICTSLCCDELSRPLETDFQSVYGPRYFSMGGLAGFSFGGVTSFGAMAAHIPDGGNCLIVYGPHVGVDSTGAVGTVERRGRQDGGFCCGSACAAARYVNLVVKHGAPQQTLPEDPLDAEQYFVGKKLLPYSKRLLDENTDTMVELPYIMFEAQDEMMNRILEQACGSVAGDGKIALVGGIQINTPEGVSDYFLPMRMEVRSNTNDILVDFLNR